jgi:hypothetical protein
MEEDNKSEVCKNDILKLLNVNNINQNADKRKRGRPKKSCQPETQIKTRTNSNSESDEDEEIILHLKLTKDEMNEVMIDKKNKNKNKNIDIDIDNNSNNNSESDIEFFKKEEKKIKTINENNSKEYIKKKGEKNKKNKKDKKDILKQTEESDFDSDEYHDILKCDNCENVDEGKIIINENLYHKLIKGMKLVKTLNRELNNKNEYIEKITPMYSSIIETVPINFEIYKNNSHEKVLLKKENISCWHCTETFNTFPIYLPETYFDGKYYVRPGFFHSFNCAAGYNLTLKDSMVNTRYSLLKKMFLHINKDKIQNPLDIKITPAPDPRYRLKKFGIGNQDTEEYNLKAKMIDCQHFDNVPSMVPVAGNLEVVFNNEPNKNVEQSYKNKIESA